MGELQNKEKNRRLRTELYLFCISIVLGGLLLLWLTVASFVFRFRHPWMTETQLFLHPIKTLLFQKVENRSEGVRSASPVHQPKP